MLRIKDLSKGYSKTVKVIDEISFELKKGSILAVLGNSGGGKSTLLRLIAGFETPETGEIFMEGQLISSKDFVLSPTERGIGMIFQDYALFPHMTVLKNIRYGYKPEKNRNTPPLEEIISLCGLKGLEKRYPHELSGGQQQKVALARALAASPKLLLMDEPFSSIDVINKKSLRSELKSVLNQTGMTALVVSHDYRDIMDLADQVLVLQQGKVIQFGTPESVRNNPADVYVAGLFGRE